MLTAAYRWIDDNILELGREMRLSFLPPLMVYMAAGISGLTGIVGTFFVKEYLGLPASFLAALGFWAGIPWALKMPLGHLVDLIWRWKSGLIYLGAGLIAMIRAASSPARAEKQRRAIRYTNRQSAAPITAWIARAICISAVV